MPRTTLMAATATIAALAIAQPADAQRFGPWRTIAFTTVSGGTDVDRINVRGDRRYRQMRLCVFNAPLRMRDFDIRFENRQRQDVRVRQRIRAGTCTRNIDLAGGRRDIEWVRLRYEPIRRGFTRPLVRLQAR
jgi:hypothetical protein